MAIALRSANRYGLYWYFLWPVSNEIIRKPKIRKMCLDRRRRKGNLTSTVRKPSFPRVVNQFPGRNFSSETAKGSEPRSFLKLSRGILLMNLQLMV
jgi:hypothetical protein